jgi:hypothetical protein
MTATLFAPLAWRVGVRLELVAYSGLAAAYVSLTAIDIIEKRMPSRLLVPAYPGLIVLFGLVAAPEHNVAAILRSIAGMAILFTFQAHPDPASPRPNRGSLHRATGPLTRSANCQTRRAGRCVPGTVRSTV